MRAALLLAFLLAFPAQAQEREGEIYQPPRTEAGEAYRREAREKRNAVDARTLSADAPLDLRPPRRVDLSTGEGTGRLLAWVVLIGLGILLVAVLLQARFGDLVRREERKAPARTTKVELADLGTADIAGTTLADIRDMDDPREALRLLLAMGLARAADANGIALRRSFTARDVFGRVPPRWRSRDVLGEIVARAEVVLFGGRPFTRDDLAPLVERAAPMLGGRTR